MNFWQATLAGALSAVAAAMGLGGGGVLIIWLTLSGVDTASARGINLLFFIPAAVISLFLHRKNGLLKGKRIVPIALAGVLGAAAGVWLSGIISSRIIFKMFGLFLAAVGGFELVAAIRAKKE